MRKPGPNPSAHSRIICAVISPELSGIPDNPTEGSREAGAMRGANLHRLAQDVYDGVVERLEAKVIEDALAATNAVESVTEGE